MQFFAHFDENLKIYRERYRKHSGRDFINIPKNTEKAAIFL